MARKPHQEMDGALFVTGASGQTGSPLPAAIGYPTNFRGIREAPELTFHADAGVGAVLIAPELVGSGAPVGLKFHVEVTRPSPSVGESFP